jgi:hypothetical protein
MADPILPPKSIMADPILPPKSIVVIHGVGDHKEDETAKAFSRALAGARGTAARWSPPSLVSRIGDVQCEVAVTEAGGPPSETFTFSAYKLEVPWPGPKWEVPLYEFFWSNLSRKGLGLLGEAAKIWRFLIGPPRLGYQALCAPAISWRDGCLLGFARFFYCLAWMLVTFRMIASLALILLVGLLKFNVWFLRYYDTMLAADIVVSTLLLAFTVSWWLLLFPTVRRRAPAAPGPGSGEPAKTSQWRLSCLNIEAFRSAVTAALALAVTILFTQAVPFSILEITKLDVQFQAMKPWRYLGEPYDDFPGFPPSHFYSINTLPGFMIYLMYGLIVLWSVIVMLVQYGLTVRTVKYTAATDVAMAKLPNPERNRVVARMRRIVLETKFFWLLMTLLVIVVVPALIWADLLSIERYDEGLYSYDPKLPTPMDVFVRSLQYAWRDFIVYLFILLTWGLLTWPRLRQTMVPVLELAFDVGAYFPPVLKSLSPAAVVDVIRGSEASSDPKRLEQQLAERLRAVIRYAYDQKSGPVAVVGHSLGSIIAMTALKEPLMGSDGQEVTIDLVMMGSPLRMLRERFSYHYGDAQWSEWKFPGVRRWLNLYRAGDPIGRDLSIPGVDEVNIANGGHSRYFEDPDVAAFLVNWLYPGLTMTARPPAGTPPGSGEPGGVAAEQAGPGRAAAEA